MAFMDPTDFPERKFDEDAFVSRMLSAGIPAIDRKLPTEPEFADVLRAAFRSANTLSAIAESKGLAESVFPTQDATPIAPTQILDELKKQGMGHHANLFADVETRQMFDARLSDLKQELADRQTLQASGAFLTELAVGVIDPVNFIPIVGGAAKAGAGVRAAARAAAVSAAGGAAISEAAMQQAQPTRDFAEGALNVGAATIFGTGLGLGAHGLATLVGKKLAADIVNKVDEKIVDLQTGGAKLTAEVAEVAKAQRELLPTAAASKDLPTIERVEPGAELKGAAPEEANGSFVANAGKDGQPTAAGAQVSDAGRDRNVYTASDRADARLFGVLPVDGLIKAVPAVLRKVPYIGEAIGQGVRNPRLELQDAISPTAREVIARLDENPYITRNEAGGLVQVDGKTFSEVYRSVEGNHAQAIKEIRDVWATSKGEFPLENPSALQRARGDGDLNEFGRRVYFAAINGGKDSGGSVAVERAANAYKSRVFDPILKLFQDAGLLIEGVNVRGADGYVPWVHVAEAIMKDKDNFIARHTEAFTETLEQEYLNALHVKGLHTQHVAHEVFALEAERNTKLRDLKDKYDGTTHPGRPKGVGEIEELKREARGKLDDIKTSRKEAEDKVKAQFEELKSSPPEQDQVAATQHRSAVEAARAEHEHNQSVLREEYDAKLQDMQSQLDLDRELLKEQHADGIARLQSILEDKLAAGGGTKAQQSHATDRLKLEREYGRNEQRLLREHEKAAAKLRTAREKELQASAKTLKDEIEKLDRTLKSDQKAALDAHNKKAKAAHDSEMKRIGEKFARDEEKSKADYARKIEEKVAERDAKLQEVHDQFKAKKDELQELPNEIANTVLKLKSPEARAERAAKLAKDYYDGATSGADHLMLGESPRDKLLPTVLKARKSPLLQKEAADRGWAETNIFDLGEIYHRNAGAAASMATVFKKARMVKNPDTGKNEMRLLADINLDEAIGQTRKDFQRAIDASGGGEQELKLRSAMTETIKNIEIIRDGLLGRRETFGSKAMQQTADLAMQFNSWRLMGGTVLSSLTDPVNIVITNGFHRTWQNGMLPALNNIKAYLGKVPASEEPAVLRSLRISGAVMEREKNAFMGAMMDLHNPSGSTDKVQGFARRLSKTFWDKTGLTAWTTFLKNVEGSVQSARIIDAADRGWGQLSQSEKAWLANLRIDEDVLGRVKTMHEQQPQKFSAGIPYGDHEQWPDRHAADRFANALSMESKNVIIQPTVGDRLAFQSTAPGHVIGQFRSFGYANMARLVARNAALSNLDGHTGNMYGGMMMLGFMGAVVDAVKFMAGDSALDGSSKKDPSKSSLDMLIKRWTETPGEQAYNAIDRAGVFLPLTEPSNILQKLGLPNLQGAFSTIARDKEGARSGASRFMHRSVGEAALGPSFGLLEDAAKLGALGNNYGKYLLGLNENFKPTLSDFSRARRMIPFGNAPGIQQIINHGHQWMGSAYDWPKE